MTAFQELASVPPKQIWDGVVARIVESERITMAIVELAPDSVVPQHRHENEQVGFVLQGSVTFTVGDETRQLGPGGTWRILANILHDVEVGPDGAVVAEVYSPIRADWATYEPQAPTSPRWPRRPEA